MLDCSDIGRSAEVDDVPALVLERGSLTERLKRLAAPKPLAVRVLREGVSETSGVERARLRLDNTSPAYVREVILGPRFEPWVFARTVMPAAALAGEMAPLVELGTHPLGEWLFARDDVCRGPVEVERTRVDAVAGPALSGLTEAAPAAGLLWSRRSLFHVGDVNCLLVSEYFLPPLWRRLR